MFIGRIVKKNMFPSKWNDCLQTVSFVAISHAVVIRVLSPDPVKDLVLMLNEGQDDKKVGPLVPLEQPGGGYAYEHTLFMAEVGATNI